MRVTSTVRAAVGSERELFGSTHPRRELSKGKLMVTIASNRLSSRRLLPNGATTIARQAATLTLSPVARRVRRKRLTYLSVGKLLQLERFLRYINSNRISGDLIEAGVALGGSAILLASHIDATRDLPRRFIGYDTFGMIPPPTEEDSEDAHCRHEEIRSGRSQGLGRADTYYGYMDDLYEKVQKSFLELGRPVDGARVSLVKGLFSDTLCKQPPEKVALAHIDCDWHSPVRECLNALRPIVQPGGVVIVDDYHNYDGCRWAVHEFLAEAKEFSVVSSRGSLVIQRAI